MTPTTARALALAEAGRAGVDPNLFMRLIQQESGWNPTATSPVGAYGLTQAMPATWAQPGFGVTPGGDRNDPQEQLRFGADYMSAMLNRYDGDPVRAAVAYNWGPGNADNWSGNMADLPAETRNYVLNVAYGQNSEGGRSLAQQTREQLEAEAAAQAQYTDEAGGVPAADNSIMSSSAISRNPEVTSLMEEEDEGFQATFHPGMALTSIGAALSAIGRGENPTQDLARIRRAYFDRRKQAEDEQRREASSRLLGGMAGVDPELAKALPPDILAAMIRQQRGFEQQTSEREATQAWRSNENVLDRGLKLGIHQDNLGIADRRLQLRADELDARTQNWDADRKAQQYRFDQEFALKEAQYANSLANETTRGTAYQQILAETFETRDPELAEYIKGMNPEAFGNPQAMNALNNAVKGIYPDAKSRGAAIEKALFLADPNVPQEQKDQLLRLEETRRVQPSLADKREIAAMEEEIKRDGKEISANNEGTAKNEQRLQQLRTMRSVLMQYPEMQTGPIRGSELFQFVERSASELGLPISESTTGAQLIDMIHKQIFPGMRPVGSGSTSDWEGRTYAGSIAGLSNTREALERSLNIAEASVARDLAYNRFVAENYDGAVDGRAMNDVKAMWKRKVDRGDPDTEPMFINFDTFTPENIAMFRERRGDLSANDMVFYKGRPLTYDKYLDEAERDLEK